MTVHTWHVTRDMWHLPQNMWHVTPDVWHMMEGEHSLKVSAPQLSGLKIDSVMKILNERMTYSVNEWINELWRVAGLFSLRL